MPDGESIVYWAQGKIHRVWIKDGRIEKFPFTKDDFGSQRSPSISCRGRSREVRCKLIRDPKVSPDGTVVVYTALNKLWIKELPDGTPRRLTKDEDFVEQDPSGPLMERRSFMQCGTMKPWGVFVSFPPEVERAKCGLGKRALQSRYLQRRFWSCVQEDSGGWIDLHCGLKRQVCTDGSKTDARFRSTSAEPTFIRCSGRLFTIIVQTAVSTSSIELISEKHRRCIDQDGK